MHEIHLDGLSISAAEERLAQLWYRLEENEIPTPALHAQFRPDGTVRIDLAFADSHEAHLALDDTVRTASSMRTRLSAQ